MNQNSGILSTPSELPINSGFTITLKPTRGLVVIYSFFTILVIVAVWISAVAFWIKGLLLTVTAVYMYNLFKKHLLMTHDKAISRLTLTDFNWCFVCYNNNDVIKADILPDSVLTEYLVILNLKPHEKSGWIKKMLYALYGESVLITRGRVGADRFRDLKRRLKLINFNKPEEPVSADQ